MEVASLQCSITTAHQDQANAQAEVADLQVEVADQQAEVADLRRRLVTAHQDKCETKAELHRYGVATCCCFLLALKLTLMHIVLRSVTIHSRLVAAIRRSFLQCFVVAICAHQLELYCHSATSAA